MFSPKIGSRWIKMPQTFDLAGNLDTWDVKCLVSLFRSIFFQRIQFPAAQHSQRPGLNSSSWVFDFLKYSSRLHLKETGTSCILNCMFISIYLKLILISISHHTPSLAVWSPFLVGIFRIFSQVGDVVSDLTACQIKCRETKHCGSLGFGRERQQQQDAFKPRF